MKLKNKGYKYSALRNIKFEKEDIPLREYPRNQLKRDSYVSLNGEWDLLVLNEGKSIEELYDIFNKKDDNKLNKQIYKITVPYAIETPLSNVEILIEPDDFIYYFKKVNIDYSLDFKYIVLHFDGIDQVSKVYINGNLVKEHEGGYTSFDVKIIKEMVKDNVLEILVAVKDYTNESYYSRGKQILKPNNWFYTSSSGIYKPVWMEYVKDNYVKSIDYITDFDNKIIEIRVNSEYKEEVAVYINNAKYSGFTNEFKKINLEDDFHPWTFDDPYLYNVKVIIKNDEISSYFGLRKIEIKESNKKLALFLNNKKILINGLLDQGYYYLGFLTPKSYKDYEQDIINVKNLGFNCLRVHVKVECDYFYYLCDKLGLLIIQDFPNGGESYNIINNFLPGINYEIFNKEKYLNYKKFGRNSKKNREYFKNEVNDIYNSLKDHPSIIMFTIFNEAWGEFDPSEFYKYFKNIDENQHLFDTCSGWIDTTNSDVYSIHAYHFTKRLRKDPFKHRPYFLSETGGLGYKEINHFDYPKFFGHKNSYSKKSYNKKYEKLYKKSIIPLMKSNDLVGVIYTQLNDCEKEGNGIYTFDREVLKLNENTIKEINSEINNIFKE